MKEEYFAPTADMLAFNYAKVVSASFNDLSDNPAGKPFAQEDTCTSGHPGGGNGNGHGGGNNKNLKNKHTGCTKN